MAGVSDDLRWYLDPPESAGPRGSLPPEAPRYQPPGSGRRRKQVVVVAAILGAVGVLIGGVVGFNAWRGAELAAERDGTGAVTGAGRVPTSELRIGDCLQVPAPQSSWVEVVPCTQGHDAEVYDVQALPAGAFPGADQVAADATSRCARAWQHTRGRDGDAAASRLGALAPTASGWSDGDRDIACFYRA